MDVLAASEARKYRGIWGDPAYREVSPGMRHLDAALDWLRPEPGTSFTDWGCGSGRVSEALAEAGYKVRCVDIAPNAYSGSLPLIVAPLWDLPGLTPTDYGFCADVMEHIPPEMVDDALDGIARHTLRGVFFQIALFDDLHFVKMGPLHLSVFPADWWIERLRAHFDRVETRMIKRKHLLAVVGWEAAQ